MEPNRQGYSIGRGLPRRQAGITALGFLFLASVFGIVGFGGLKIAPLYMQKMRIQTVFEDLKSEYDGTGTTSGTLRRTLVQRLYIEGITIRPDDVLITPTKAGFNVGLKFDNRTSFIADIYFLVAVDEQIEIRR